MSAQWVTSASVTQGCQCFPSLCQVFHLDFHASCLHFDHLKACCSGELWTEILTGWTVTKNTLMNKLVLGYPCALCTIWSYRTIFTAWCSWNIILILQREMATWNSKLAQLHQCKTINPDKTPKHLFTHWSSWIPGYLNCNWGRQEIRAPSRLGNPFLSCLSTTLLKSFRRKSLIKQ